MDRPPPRPRPYDPRVDDDSVRVVARWAVWELTARETSRGRLVHYDIRCLLGDGAVGGILLFLAVTTSLVASAAVLRRCPP